MVKSYKTRCRIISPLSLRWRHNDHDSVSNHQPHGCLLNRLFRRRSKKTSKLRITGLCAGNSPGPVNSPHKWPVTRKKFPFDDVIMWRKKHWPCKLLAPPRKPLERNFTVLLVNLNNWWRPSNVYIRHLTGSSLVQAWLVPFSPPY